MTNFYSQDALADRAKTLETVGLDTPVPPLRRGPNGQIDVNYYLERGLDERAKAARQIFGAFGRAIRRILVGGTQSHRVPRRMLHHV